jgi:hypothetical protein
LGVEGGLLGTPGLRCSTFGLALLTFARVVFSSEPSLLATADVFANHTSVDSA